MAGVVNEQTSGLSAMMSNTASDGMFLAAKTYKSAIENSYYAVLGATECTFAGISAACTVWKRGLSGNLKELAKECYGINNFRKAGEELCKSVIIEGEEKVRNPLSARIGAAGGEVVNAISKIAATNAALTIGTAYGVGTICNQLGAQYSATSLIGAAQVTATGLNTIGSIGIGAASYLVTPASLVASVGFSAIKAGVGMAIDNPAVAGIAAGSGAFLYLASHETVKVSQADEMVAKIFHGTMATMALAVAVAIPVAYTLS